MKEPRRGVLICLLIVGCTGDKTLSDTGLPPEGTPLSSSPSNPTSSTSSTPTSSSTTTSTTTTTPTTGSTTTTPTPSTTTTTTTTTTREPCDPALPPSEAEEPAPLPPQAAACFEAGGVCLWDEGACESQGGKRFPGGDLSCSFEHGSAPCCLPPAPAPSGTLCEAQGGIWAPVSGCLMVAGGTAPASDPSPYVPAVCCVPHAVCGVEEAECCQDGWAARPTCDRGEWICPDGGWGCIPTLVGLGTCVP